MGKLFELFLKQNSYNFPGSSAKKMFFFSTTLLLYKLDTLLLKQKKLPVLDLTGFFFRIRTQVKALVLHTSAFTWVLMRKKKSVTRPSPEYSCGKRNPLYPIRAASFASIVLYLIHKLSFHNTFKIIIEVLKT
jgi:hypothetical protein